MGRPHESQNTRRTPPDAEQKLGLELFLQHPDQDAVDRIPVSRDAEGTVLYPEVDADGDHVHFEMVPMEGESLLWLTIRRETSPSLAASSLRKIADLIERHGDRVLSLLQGNQGSFAADGDLVSGALRLSYDENGDLEIPESVDPPGPTSSTIQRQGTPRS